MRSGIRPCGRRSTGSSTTSASGPSPRPAPSVTLTGPLGQPNERAVALTHERGGSYGDVERRLSVEPQQRYRLDVVYPTGEAYTAETAVPRAASVELPAEVPLRLELLRGEVGYYEQDAEVYHYPCEEVDGADLSVFKRAKDRWLDANSFALGPNDRFEYEDRGDHYTRGPRSYFIQTNGQDYPTSRCSLLWTGLPLAIPRALDSFTHYGRYLQIGPELALFVARVTDRPDYRIFDDPDTFIGNEVWNPTMWAQVNWKLDDLGLWPEPETGAAVTLTGPLGQPNERAVVLTHERGGSYGDVEGLLSVEPQQRYRLDVVYPTGEAYTAETAVPHAAEVELPTEVPLALQLVRGEVGYYEKNAAGPFRYPCEQVEGADLSVYKSASDRWIDALGFDIPPGGFFEYEDRGDHYVRGPRVYFIDTNGQNYPHESV